MFGQGLVFGGIAASAGGGAFLFSCCRRRIAVDLMAQEPNWWGSSWRWCRCGWFKNFLYPYRRRWSGESATLTLNLFREQLTQLQLAVEEVASNSTANRNGTSSISGSGLQQLGNRWRRRW